MCYGILRIISNNYHTELFILRVPVHLTSADVAEHESQLRKPWRSFLTLINEYVLTCFINKICWNICEGPFYGRSSRFSELDLLGRCDPVWSAMICLCEFASVEALKRQPGFYYLIWECRTSQRSLILYT